MKKDDKDDEKKEEYFAEEDLSEDEKKVIHDHMSRIGKKGRATLVRNIIDKYKKGEISLEDQPKSHARK